MIFLQALFLNFPVIRNIYHSIVFLYLAVLFLDIRHGSHWGGSLQDGLGDEWTCGMTLASAYVLCYLSAMWLQLQMIGRNPRWK